MLGRLKSKLSVKTDGSDKRSSEGSGSPLSQNDVDLTIAVKAGDAEAVESCLRKKCRVNLYDEEGNTLLYYCSVMGYTDIAIKLLELRANLNKPSTGGNTALHGAAEEGKTAMIALLLEHGADPNVSNKQKDTPLHLACRYGHAEAVTMLLNNGADSGLRDKDGRRPLDVALHNSQLDAAKRVAGHTRDQGLSSSARRAPVMRNNSGIGRIHTTFRTHSTDEIRSVMRETEEDFSAYNGLKSAMSWDIPATPYSQSGQEVCRTFRSAPSDWVNDVNLDDGVTTSTVSSTGSSRKSRLLGAIWNAATHRTNSSNKSANTALPPAAPAPKMYGTSKRNGLWNSSDVLEQTITQTLKQGMTFGDSERYEVKELINMNGACVAIVRHKWELTDCFAKFYINQTMFETEKRFYLFWPNLGSAMMADIQQLWPVIKELYPVGMVANVNAGCIVLEKGDETLSDVAKRRIADHKNGAGLGREADGELHSIVSQIIESLSMMHEYGWVHRDIKPSNIVYFSGHRRWKLVDFGISGQAGMKMPIQYTLKYAAPEVVIAQYDGVEDIDVTCAMDIWSLGMVMASLYSHQKVFEDIKQSEWLQMLLGKVQFPFEINPFWFEENLPANVAPLVRGMLCREGSERPTIKELEEASFYFPTMQRQSTPVPVANIVSTSYQ